MRESPLKKKLFGYLKVTIGLVIIFFLIRSIGFSNIKEKLEDFNILYFIPVILIYIPVNLLTTCNHMILFKVLERRLPFFFLFRALILSNSIGLVSPGKIGDFSIIFWLKSKNIDYGISLAVSFVDKIITLIAVSILAILGSAIYLQGIYLIIICSFVIIVLALFFFVLGNKKVKEFVKKIILRKYESKFKGFYGYLCYIIKNKKVILLNFLLTILKFLLDYIWTFLLFKGFDIDVSYLNVVFISSINIIIGLIPISLSGLGIKEISGAYLYQLLADLSIIQSTTVMLLGTFRVYLLAFIVYILNLDIMRFKKEE